MLLNTGDLATGSGHLIEGRNWRVLTRRRGLLLALVVAVVVIYAVPLSLAHAHASTVTIQAVDQNGKPVSGYQAVLYDSSGDIIDTGYVTTIFATNAGESYRIAADSYGNCTFAQWSNGSTSNPIGFTATTSAATFTAVYNC